jgi:hypothetical protein
MIKWRRAVGLGFFSWAAPFLLSFLIFPFKKANAPLFDALMGLIVLLNAGVLLKLYFRERPVAVWEAVAIGVLWFTMNLVFDYPMFAYGPMRMTALAYYSEIGVSYLAFPAFAFGAARLARP